MELTTAIGLGGLGITLGGLLWRVAAGAAETRASVEQLRAAVTALQAQVKALDEGKVSAKTLTERLVGQRRDILQRVEIARLSNKPVTDGEP